jgi:hypothetical protein
MYESPLLQQNDEREKKNEPKQEEKYNLKDEEQKKNDINRQDVHILYAI